VKVLLAVDGSPHSEVAIAEVARRPWPAETEVLVLTVIHATAPLLPDPSLILAAAHVQQIQERTEQAPALVRSACEQLRRSVPGLNVLTVVGEGTPKEVILEAARKWGADLIVVGSHGYGRVRRFVLGSVAHGVLTEGPCSVLVARTKRMAVEDVHEEETTLAAPATVCH
jgi:nucleotide-binding universal stress UspA family protein